MRAARFWTLLAVLLFAATTLAGCFDSRGEGVEADPDGAEETPDPGDGDNVDLSGPRPSRPEPEPGSGEVPPPRNGTNNTTAGNSTNVTLPPPEWPAIGAAKVRPGVQIVVTGDEGTGLCTSNFLFRSRTNGTLYLGLAAHCIGSPDIDAKVGSKAVIRNLGDQNEITTWVAYSSWEAMGWSPGATTAGDDVHPHDFALVAIPADEVGIVHPAVLFYGGPVAMADYDSVAATQRLLVYGNSNLYPRPGDLDPQEGVVLGKGSENYDGSVGYYIDAHVELAPVPGDSGSGLMTKDGKALGALSTITSGLPYGTWWRYSSVPHGVEYANAHGWSLELQTWELIDNGLLP